MNTYLVRTKAEKKNGSKGWMGLVVARSAGELFWMLDDVTDPWNCVFRKLEPREPAMVMAPFQVDDGILETDTTENAHTDELFDGLISGEEGWRSFRASRSSYGPSYDSNRAKTPWLESRYERLVASAVQGRTV